MTIEPVPPLDGGDAEGGSSAAQPTEPKPPRNKPRLVPAPWLDCERCGWRHYPGRVRGGWGLAAVCTSCGAKLVARTETDQVSR